MTHHDKAKIKYQCTSTKAGSGAALTCKHHSLATACWQHHHLHVDPSLPLLDDLVDGFNLVGPQLEGGVRVLRLAPTWQGYKL
jgi:hypothetical protein